MTKGRKHRGTFKKLRAREIKKVNILNWNIRGVGQHLQDNDWVEFIRKFDIIVLTETQALFELDLDIKFSDYSSKQLKGTRLSFLGCLLYTSPSPRDLSTSRMPSSA